MVYETYLPQCLAMGIGASDFWKLNIRKLRPFLKAEDIKFDKRNRELHLAGQYIYEAVCVALANAFRRSGDPVLEYSAEPYKFMSKEEWQEQEQKRRIEMWKAQFASFAEGIKNRLETENELRP